MISLKNQATLSEKCFEADRFWPRLRGWIGKTEFEPGEGLWFPKCRSVHMWMMRVPIDVVFVRHVSGQTNTFEVTSVRERVRPWRLLPLMDPVAHDTLELPPGRAAECGLAKGDLLCLG